MARLVRALVALLVSLPLLAACSDDLGSGGDQGYVDGSGAITRLPAAERKRPGEIEGESLEGEPLSLASYAGKVVVVNVWGSWCADCRAEATDFAEAAAELEPENVVFLGINTRDPSVDQGLAYQRRFEVPYSSIFDPGGRTLLAFRGTLPLNAIPSTVVIDADGKVAASILGRIPSRRTLVELVRDVRDGAAS